MRTIEDMYLTVTDEFGTFEELFDVVVDEHGMILEATQEIFVETDESGNGHTEIQTYSRSDLASMLKGKSVFDVEAEIAAELAAS